MLEMGGRAAHGVGTRVFAQNAVEYFPLRRSNAVQPCRILAAIKRLFEHVAQILRRLRRRVEAVV